MNIWKIVVGLALLATGAFFILANIGVIPRDYSTWVSDYWPAAIIFFGVALLIDGITKKGTRSKRFDRIYFSFAVMTTGLVLLENRIHYFLEESVELWTVLLSLFLIYIGIRLIFFKSSSVVITVDGHEHRRHHAHKRSGEYVVGGAEIHKDVTGDDEDDGEEEDGEDGDGAADDRGDRDGSGGVKGSRRGVYMKNSPEGGKATEQFVGELRLGDKSWAPESGDYSVNVGEMNVDLTTAILQDGETTLNLTGWIGEINVLIPDELAVDISATVNIGSVEFFGEEEQSGISRNNIRFRSDDYDEAVKKVRIQASLNVGEISVKRI